MCSYCCERSENKRPQAIVAPLQLGNPNLLNTDMIKDTSTRPKQKMKPVLVSPSNNFTWSKATWPSSKIPSTLGAYAEEAWLRLGIGAWPASEVVLARNDEQCGHTEISLLVPACWKNHSPMVLPSTPGWRRSRSTLMVLAPAFHHHPETWRPILRTQLPTLSEVLLRAIE